jgi:hypothetical protein
VLDQHGQLLRAALGFVGLPSNDHALHVLRSYLDSWSGIGRIAVGMARQGYDLQLTRYDERGWRGEILHDGDGALADERDWYGMGAHALARDAAGGVGGVELPHVKLPEKKQGKSPDSSFKWSSLITRRQLRDRKESGSRPLAKVIR